MSDLSVIVPCFNEENNIEVLALRILDSFNKNSIKGEIIFVNDGSSDKTLIKIERLSRQLNNIFVINHVKNLGITEAWSSGLKISHGRYIVTIDADLQYKPEDIMQLYNQITKNNYDLVQGWRKEYKDKNLFRRFLSRALSRILNILFFKRINDIKSSFVIYKRDVFFDILKSRREFRTFQHFFILCALRKGYSLRQVPITFYPRMRGESFIKNPISFSFKVLLDIPKAILIFWGYNKKKILNK
jgi:phenylacetate-CoA ligase